MKGQDRYIRPSSGLSQVTPQLDTGDLTTFLTNSGLSVQERMCARCEVTVMMDGMARLGSRFIY